jgi:hypothetical protein
MNTDRHFNISLDRNYCTNSILTPPPHVHLLVKDTICIGGPRPYTEEVSVYAGGVVVHIVQLGPGLVPSGHHGAHTKTVPSILKPERGVREGYLGGMIG